MSEVGEGNSSTLQIKRKQQQTKTQRAESFQSLSGGGKARTRAHVGLYPKFAAM